MIFIHLGDLHIGKSLGDFDLIDDQRYILEQIIDLAVENHADAVMISGDIYDRTIPSEAAVRLFNDFIKDLVARDIAIYAISGNHDSDERLNFGASLFESNRVYINTRFEGQIKKYCFQDEYGPVNIYLMPFIKASQVRHCYPEEEIASYDQAVRAAVSHSQVNTEERNILLAHQFVTGGHKETELDGSEGIAAQSVGLVEMVGADCFDAFDYVALGHIHRAQKLGREEVRYSGSPLKYSLSECDRDKSVPVVEIGEKGKVKIRLEPLRPKRDLRHIKGMKDVLLFCCPAGGSQDFMYITLTDEDIVNDAMAIFQQYYPNTVRIDYDNSHTRDLKNTSIRQVTEEKTFEEMMRYFYQQIYGCEISEDEVQVMKEVAKEAGIDETH